MLTNLCCISHFTSLNSIKKILNSGYLHTVIEQRDLKLELGEGLDSEKNQLVTNQIAQASIKHQFPGIYCEIIPKNTEWSFFTKIVIIFSTDLLKQNNWHLNLADQNGKINNKTYVKNTIGQLGNYQKIIKKLKEHGDGYTELVFHNQINIKLISKILYTGFSTDQEYIELVKICKLKNIKVKLRKYVLVKKTTRKEFKDGITKRILSLTNNIQKEWSKKNLDEEFEQTNNKFSGYNKKQDMRLSYDLPPLFKCSKEYKLKKNNYKYLDMTSLPFLSYYVDTNYTGITQLSLNGKKNTPIDVYRYILQYTGHKMKDLKKIKKVDEQKFNEIIYKYHTFEELWHNRELQKIKRLPPFTI
jgi:hypothetical protein